MVEPEYPDAPTAEPEGDTYAALLNGEAWAVDGPEDADVAATATERVAIPHCVPP